MTSLRWRNWLPVGAALILLWTPFPAAAQSVPELQNQIKNTKSDIASLQQKIQQLRSGNAQLQDDITQLRGKLQILKAQEAALQEKNQTLQKHLSHLQGNVATEGPNAGAALGLKPLIDTGDSQPANKKPAAKKKPVRSPRPHKSSGHRSKRE